MAAKKVRSPTPGDTILEKDRLRDVLEQPLNEKEKELVRRAYSLFDFFYEKHRRTHDEMRKMRLMRQLAQDEKSMTAPLSNTLNSCADNVIADQIDNMPEAKLYPEREETAQSAEEMSDVVSYVLYQAGWPGKYQTLMEDAVITGTGVAEVFWDDDMENGEGMVNVIAWHPEDFYPDPMYEDIQDGRACFKVTHTTIAWVEEHYPEARGYVRSDEYSAQDAEVFFDVPEGDEKTTLLEFWYKRYDAEQRNNRVHMALLAGRALLYSTELGFGGAGKEEYREGVYAHGLYPFTLYKYRHVYRSPFGSGLFHDYADTQHAIDRYQKYIDDNARQSSVQRHFIRRGSGINADIVADLSNTIIEWEGNDIREVLQSVQASPLNGQVYQIMQYMTDAMKQDCGQNQFARGEGGMGVTAATAIQSLQEAGGKITRWHTEIFKDAFREMIEQLMWVLSEYMEPKRTMRIVGGWDSTGNMRDRLVTLSAPGIEGDRLPKPAYTVRVQVQKNNPLQIQIDNEFLQMVAQVCAQAGQPLPPEAVIGLMQGYPTKSSVLRVVRENSAQQAQMEQLMAQVEQLYGQLEQQKAANKGLIEGMQNQGGGAIRAQQEKNAPSADYGALMTAGQAVKEA